MRSNQDECKAFKRLREHAENSIRLAKDPEAYIGWSTERERLKQILQDATEVIRPPDLYIPYEDYVRDKGDPRTNGLGHQMENNSLGELCVNRALCIVQIK